jgi:hypothetical protein
MQLSIPADKASSLIPGHLQQPVPVAHAKPTQSHHQQHRQQQEQCISQPPSSLPRPGPGAAVLSAHADLDQPDPLEQAWVEQCSLGAEELPAGLTPGLWAVAVAAAEGNCRVVGGSSVASKQQGRQVRERGQCKGVSVLISSAGLRERILV